MTFARLRLDSHLWALRDSVFRSRLRVALGLFDIRRPLLGSQP